MLQNNNFRKQHMMDAGKVSLPTAHPQFIILKQNLRLRCDSVKSSGIPVILLPPRPRVGKDRSSQVFSKPDSQLQKLLNSRSGEI